MQLLACAYCLLNDLIPVTFRRMFGYQNILSLAQLGGVAYVSYFGEWRVPDAVNLNVIG